MMFLFFFLAHIQSLLNARLFAPQWMHDATKAFKNMTFYPQIPFQPFGHYTDTTMQNPACITSTSNAIVKKLLGVLHCLEVFMPSSASGIWQGV